MAELLLLEFAGLDESNYAKVNAELGIDMDTGQGAWPKGLQTHVAGMGDDGTFRVIEIWESRQAQEDFLHSRLGAALAAGGVTAEPKVSWSGLAAHHEPGR